MAHLGDRITDYVFGEMNPSETAAAQAHIRECLDCARQVEELQRTRAMLQALPDAEPPRPIVFEVERKVGAMPWLWKWAAPAASALAASVVTAMLMSPRPAEPPKTAEVAAVTPATPTTQPSPDFQKMAAEIRASSEAWLAAELEKRDQAHERDLQRVHSEIAYWERQQLAVSRETMDTARTIQLLAQKVPSED